MTCIANEQVYSFAPSQVLQNSTLSDIRARLGLENAIPDMERFNAILDHKLTIHINLATSTDGYNFVRQTEDGEIHSDGPDGPSYSVLLQNLGGSIRFLIGNHISDDYVGSDDTFLRYQMKNDEAEYSTCSELLPVNELKFILPSREQMIDLHHYWYLLPAQDDDDVLSNASTVLNHDLQD